MSTGHPELVRATAAAKAVLGDRSYRSAWEQSRQRRDRFCDLIADGMAIDEALREIGVSRSAYKKWRHVHRDFAARVDIIRAGEGAATLQWDGGHTSFAETFLNWQYAQHQLEAVQMMEAIPLGHIGIMLWPPDHGKTATYENYATEKISTDPENYRGTITSESLTIAKKILGKLRLRFEPDGPFPELVRRFGPFKPPAGQSREKTVAQPWGDQHFNVYKKRRSDERDYSMQALGFKSSIVSTRSTHLHIDDIQSKNTSQPARSRAVEGYIRQDCLTRTGAHGINTWACTRVAEDDAVGAIIDDEAMSHLVHVKRFPAIRIDPVTFEEVPLWPERYNLDQLWDMRVKATEDVWDLSFMHNPGTTARTRTFTDEVIENARSTTHTMMGYPEPGTIIYIGLDPALGGRNCILAVEVTQDGKLVIRWVNEQMGFRRNEQIMEALGLVIGRMKLAGALVTDVVVEENNFQRGLKNDDRLKKMMKKNRCIARGHLSGNNKYDPDIGIPSMASSMNSGEIVIPYADDGITRAHSDELIRQLKAWKPGQRGNRFRMDYIMALWFVWILWQDRLKKPPKRDQNQIKRDGLPWQKTEAGLYVPKRGGRRAA